MNKLSRLILLATFLLAVPLYTHAANTTADPIIDTSVLPMPKGNPPGVTENLPQPSRITVKEIALDSESYIAGDTVTGTFLLINQGDDTISDANYSISLVGDFQPDTLAGTFYDTKFFGPVFVEGKKEKKISFSYVLPKAVSKGSYGIEIQARLKSGQPLGWADSLISITSGISPVEIVNEYIEKAKGEYFTPKAGPTIKKAETASMIVTLSSSSPDPIDLTPNISIFNRTETGEKLLEKNSESVRIISGKKTDVRIALPLFDYKAGVYLGTLRLLDKNGVERAPHIEFRYIIEGPVATIQLITSDKQFADKNESVGLTIMVSGTPYDIVTGKVPTVGSAELRVNLYNENNTEVASSTQTIDLEKINDSIKIPLTVSERSGYLKVKATVVKDGDILATYENNLSSEIHNFKTNMGLYLKSTTPSACRGVVD